jgi:hypothetical protein
VRRKAFQLEASEQRLEQRQVVGCRVHAAHHPPHARAMARAPRRPARAAR